MSDGHKPCQECDATGWIVTGWDEFAYENIEEMCATFEGTGRIPPIDTSGNRYVDLGDGYFAHLNMSADASPKAVEAVTELMRLAKKKMQEGAQP